MIYNENKIYAKVWKITPSDNGKYIDLQITTSEKDQDGNYINSSWFPRCIGKSVNTLKELTAEDRIVITKSKFTNERKTLEDGTVRSFFRFIILEAKIDGKDKNEGNSKSNKIDTIMTKEAAEEVDEECPW